MSEENSRNNGQEIITPNIHNTALQDSALGKVVSVGDSPSFFHVYFRLHPGKHVHPGQWVAIEAQNDQGSASLILARVIDAQEVNPHEDPFSSNIREVLPFASSYAEEGKSTVIYRLAEIEPMEEALLDNDGKVIEILSVQTLPKSGALVFRAEMELKTRALGLHQNPNDGLYMGGFFGESGDEFILSKNIIQRHVAIVGGIGSGKSYTRGVLGEELHSWGVPQINIDVNGEMVDAAVELGGVNMIPGKGGFTLPLSALTAQDVLDAVPSIDSKTVMAELVRHAHEELLRESLQTGNHFMVNDLVEKIKEVAPVLDAKSNSSVPAASRVQSLNRLTYLGQPYDWETALKPGAFINIDCRGFLVSDLRVIVAAIARDLQRLAKAKKIPFVIFSIDEAHLVAPAQEETVCLQVLRELARIGRHYRIGLIMTTQSPQDLDKSILKRLLTRFLHAIEPDQLEALRGVFSDASKELIKQLPKLPQGVCIVTGAFETIRHATVIDVRDRKTTHGGGTPDIWSDFAERGWDSKKDLSLKRKKSEEEK